MAFEISRNPTLIESLTQGFNLAAPGLIQGAQQRTALGRQQEQQQALQQLGTQLGIDIPQGISPQLGNLLVAQQQKASLDPGSAASGFTLGQGQQRFDASGRPIASVAGDDGGFTLGQGQQRFDASGNLIAGVDPQTQAPKGPSAFGEKQAQINALSNIPVANRTPEQQAQLNDLLNIKPPKSADETALLKSQIAKNRADANRVLRESKGKLTTEQKTSQGNILRKEFNGLSTDFVKSRDAFTRVKASAADPSAAGDLALIFNFMKVLDPGSVVRESEFANAAASGSFGERVKGAAAKITRGERLSAAVRKDFLDRAGRLFRAQEGNQGKLIKRYTSLSNRFGINPENIVAGLDSAIQETQTANDLTEQDLDNMTLEQLQNLQQ